jgi:hypothetical protein
MNKELALLQLMPERQFASAWVKLQKTCVG